MARTPRAETLILDIETVPDVERWQRPEPPASGSRPEPPATEAPFAESERSTPPLAGPHARPGDTPEVPAAERPTLVDLPRPGGDLAAAHPGPAPRSERGERRDRDGFPPIWAHRIIVIGCMLLDHDYRLKRFGVVESARGGEGSADDRERALLEAFSRFVDKERPLIVTYNGRSFDLPVIAMRSLCHAVPLGWYYRDRDLRARYSPEGHFDLCDWLADHGATRAGKLDQLARLIGLPGKVGVDGSQVEGLYAGGELAAIERYCKADVAQTALLFLRFRLLQGALTVGAYRDRVGALVADPRITDVLDGIDRDRLLGPPAPPDPADAWIHT